MVLIRKKSVGVAGCGVLLGCHLLGTPVCVLAQNEAPPVLLANVYDAGVSVADYWVSEKYDGIRAWWDGRRLLTRNGNTISAPQWFVAGLPPLPLDGELWIGRGRFETLASTVLDVRPDHDAWRMVRFMVFDLPEHEGDFTRRLIALRQLLAGSAAPWVHLVAQRRVADDAELEATLRAVVAAGGEGLMLHRGGSRYKGGRSDDLLKLKPWRDAEARVVGHLPGNGKYRGMLGALLVESPDGVRFRIGTGFTDAQRRAPPPIGSRVTYRYQSLTRNGLPRFASFVRVRRDEPDR